MAETENGEGAAKKSGGMMGMVLPALLAGGAAFAVSYLQPFGGNDGATDQAEAAEMTTESVKDGDAPPALPKLAGAKDDKGKKKKGEAPEAAPSLLLPLEPIVVSLAMEGNDVRRAPRLRITIVVEGDEKRLADKDVVALMLRDRFTAAMRALPPQTLGGPGGLEILREALKTEANSLMGEGAIHSVLITDFAMT